MSSAASAPNATPSDGSRGHPHIVPLFDAGVTAEGTPFLVMELMHGGSLGGTGSALVQRRHRSTRSTPGSNSLMPWPTHTLPRSCTEM